MNVHQRPVVQTNRATRAAHCVWNARENKPVDPDSVIRSLYRECLMIIRPFEGDEPRQRELVSNLMDLF